MSVCALPLPVNPVVTREQYERDKFTIKLIRESEGAINSPIAGVRVAAGAVAPQAEADKANAWLSQRSTRHGRPPVECINKAFALLDSRNTISQLHSTLSATSGSTFVARRAGT